MKRVTDVIDYINQKYPALSRDKFDIAKVGTNIYIYLVTRDNKLARESVFRGNLPAVEAEPALKKYLEGNIESVMRKYNYC
jgi:hypothetical protein